MPLYFAVDFYRQHYQVPDDPQHSLQCSIEQYEIHKMSASGHVAARGLHLVDLHGAA